MMNEMDRELLLGFLARRSQSSDAETLREAIDTWTRERRGSLVEFLREQVTISDEDSVILEYLSNTAFARVDEPAQTIMGTMDRSGGATIQDVAATYFQSEPLKTLVDPPTRVLESVSDLPPVPPSPDEESQTLGADEVLATIFDEAVQTVCPSTIAGDDAYVGADDTTRLLGTSGRFRRISSHAKGGLGEVFLAEDREIRRRVALKEIQERHADNWTSRSRFLLEAEVTGQLEHPGIVPIYGLGNYPDGRPYYAMRFIRGVSLKEKIAEFHSAARLSSRAIRELLGNLIDVCQAVHFAHSKGVIHRDIKPANIMIGDFGETLVVDWGLAKIVGTAEPVDGMSEIALSSPDLTNSTNTIAGSAMGTPQFMSPEQARGEWKDIGPTSDIYSLGATLYSALTGKPPLPDSDVQTTLSRVSTGDFPPPRHHQAGVPVALEEICLKAMRLNPHERYSSARELAEELSRWLDDEPVEAYPEPFWSRALRWGRHHMPIVSGVAALLLTAIAGLALSTGVISAARDREESQKRLALENFDIAKDGTDALLAGVGEVDPGDVPEMEPIRRDLLDRAKRSYARFLSQRSSDPLVRWGTGRASTKLGDIERLLGHAGPSETSYLSAISTLKELAREFPNVMSYRQELASAQHGLGVLYKNLNRFGEAEISFREAIRIRQPLVSDGNSDATRMLDESRYFLGAVLAKLGGRTAEAKGLYESAIASQKRLISGLAAKPEQREKLARYLNNLAILQAGTGDPVDALKTAKEGLDVYKNLEKALFEKPGPLWQNARLHNNVGSIVLLNPSLVQPQLKEILGEGDASKVIGDSLADARDTLEYLVLNYPYIPQYKQELASVCNNIGLYELRSTKNPEAVVAFRKSFGLLDGLTKEFEDVPDYHQKRALALIEIHSLSFETDPAGAEKAFNDALGELKSLVAAHSSVTDYENGLGRALYQVAVSPLAKSKPAEALKYLEEAIEHHRAVAKARPDSPIASRYLAEDFMELANLQREMGNLDKSAEAAEQCMQVAGDQVDCCLSSAALLTRCAVVAKKSNAPSEDFERRAIECLGRTIDRGLPLTLKQLDSPEFEFLRNRSDFQRVREAVRTALEQKRG